MSVCQDFFLKEYAMVKARLLFLVSGLLVSSSAQSMLKQLIKPFLTQRSAILMRSFSVLTPEEVDRSKQKIKEIQRAAYAEHWAFRLVCSGIALNNRAFYEIIKENHEQKNEKLLQEFQAEVARLKAHRDIISPNNALE